MPFYGDTASVWGVLAKPEQWRPTTSPGLHPRPRQTLNNLATFLSDFGRREEALGVVLEAVDLYRELAASNPDLHARPRYVPQQPGRPPLRSRSPGGSSRGGA